MKYLLFVLGMLSSLGLYAQAGSSDIVREILEANKADGHVISFDFILTRTVSIMDGNLVSTGHAELSYPEKIVWSTYTPYEKTSVMTPGKYLMKEADFDITLCGQDDSHYELLIKPLRKNQKSLFASVRLFARKGNLLVDRIILTDSNDDLSDIKISSYRISDAR